MYYLSGLIGGVLTRIFPLGGYWPGDAPCWRGVLCRGDGYRGSDATPSGVG